MKLGKFELLPLSDGSFFLDGGTMFGVVPKVLWSKIVQPDELNRVEIPLNCLLVRTGDTNILIDTGIGNKLDEKFLEIYSVKQEKNLDSELRRLGLQPEDIDYVVNTHLHFDHCGWNTISFSSVRLNSNGGIGHEVGSDKDRSGTAMPGFPNAKYVIQKQEWYDATHPNERTRASYFKENFIPLKEYGLLLLVEGEYEIVPGIKVINTIGHTKGHQSVLIESEGKKAIYWGDFMPTSAHIKLPYHTSFDLYPMDLLELKKKYLRKVIDEHWLMIFEHDPNVVFAYLVEEGGKPVLKPIQSLNPNDQIPNPNQCPSSKIPNTKPYDLKERTLQFAKEVVEFIKTLPKTSANIEYTKQLIRSSGSIGSNYIEADEALGKKDFLMRIRICRKESK
ncbi:MAG: four helix bundle protein, partial [candidate division WOR-3 bacterium]